MDPNANLREQLEISKKLQDETLEPDEAIRLGERLAELVLAMNEWLTSCGFLPDLWACNRYSGDGDPIPLDMAVAYGAPFDTNELEYNYKITLVDVGPDKILCVKALRDIFGYTAHEVFYVLNHLPYVLKNTPWVWEHEELRKQLEAIGATIRVEETP